MQKPILFNLKLKKLHSEYRELFGSELGKRVLSDMSKRHGLYQENFNPSDPMSMSFWEGRRHVILDILRFINSSPEDLEKLYKEVNGRDDIGNS